MVVPAAEATKLLRPVLTADDLRRALGVVLGHEPMIHSLLASVPRLFIPRGKSAEPLEESGERFDDPLLLVAVIGLAVEP